MSERSMVGGLAWRIGAAALLAAGIVGCKGGETPPVEKPPAEAVTKKAAAEPAAEKPAGDQPATEQPAGEMMSKETVVFDPRKPPAGFTRCHRNHCHRVGGGVASYAQVMKEIGATEIVGVPKRAPMPTAPPDVAAPPADAIKTPSGLATKVIEKGDGAKPGPDSVVVAHYTGWTTDGKPFDSSVARGQAAKFPLNRVIPGWTEGLQLMSVGETRRLWIPEELAYKGRPGRPAGMLVFDVELLEIQ